MGAKGEWVRPDGRAGRWAQREARRRQWESIQTNWLLLLSLLVMASVPGLAVGLYLGGWWGGFVAGAAVATGLALPLYMLVMVTGAAPRSMGAFAEGQVSEAIQRGLVGNTRMFDRVAFRDWDVDHLVVAPAMALAIETKWSADGWDVHDQRDRRLQSAVQQVTRSMRSLRLFLRSEQIGLPLDVERLVVVCGPRGEDEGRPGCINDCPIVRVRNLRPWIEEWCRKYGEPGLDEARLTTGCDNIASFLDVRDAFDARKSPEHLFVLHGALAPMQAVWEAVIAFFLGMCLSIGAFALGRGSLWVGLALMLLVLAAGTIGLLRLGRKAGLLGWAGSAVVLGLTVLHAIVQNF